MDMDHLDRLREEQVIAIEETESRIEALNGFKDDYVALNNRLQTLPDKTSHDVMVPFGKLAFMPGKLVHTNEIMVLLGDNWFADRSASQACEIVSRRIKGIQEQIKNLGQQKSLLEPRLQLTSELEDMAQARGDIREIVEEYDPEKEKLWKEKHKKSMQRYAQQLKKETKVEDAPVLHKGKKTDEEFWARLDYLEKLEAEKDEMNKSSSEENKSDASNGSSESDDEATDEEIIERFKKVKLKKRVSWHDEIEATASSKNTIFFSHTPSQPLPLHTPYTEDVSITNPADVYKLCKHHSQPKSILKSASSENLQVAPSSPDTPSLGLPRKPAVLGGEVVERVTTAEVIMPQKPPVTDVQSVEITKFNVPPQQQSSGTAAAQPNKKISRFKAMRQQQK